MDLLKNKEQAIRELGLSALPPAEQDEALERIGKIIFQNVLLRVADMLNAEDQQRFIALLGSASPEEGDKVLEFLQTRIPDFNDIVAEEVARFKKESAAFMRSLDS